MFSNFSEPHRYLYVFCDTADKMNWANSASEPIIFSQVQDNRNTNNCLMYYKDEMDYKFKYKVVPCIENATLTV